MNDIETREIPLDEIFRNPQQPRQTFNQDELQELANSIKETGLLTPILVRPTDSGYEIVHGERRWRACQLAELDTIRAEIRELDDDEAYTMTVIENEQRANLSPIETANGLKKMMDDYALTQGQVARKIGKSRDWVAQKLRLLNLPTESQTLMRSSELTEGHGRQLLKLQTAGKADKINGLAAQAASEKWSVSRLQNEVDLTIADQEVCHVTQDEPTLSPEAMAIIEAFNRLSEAEADTVRAMIVRNHRAVSRDTMKGAN